MKKLKKGDIVARISYNKDVLFEITRIISLSNKKKIMILKGITERIEADSPEEDLILVDKRIVKERVQTLEDKITSHINQYINKPKDYLLLARNKFPFLNGEKRGIKKIYTGKILHLDGDRKYSEKSIKYYRNLGLNAIVRNIPENKQPQFVRSLLDRYEPDILVITGHDGMIKKGTGFNDIYNYRNSRYFIKTVNEARIWSRNHKDLAIFAGACQSFYEAIIGAGANFASSPRKNNDRFYRSTYCSRKNSYNR